MVGESRVVGYVEHVPELWPVGPVGQVWRPLMSCPVHEGVFAHGRVWWKPSFSAEPARSKMSYRSWTSGLLLDTNLQETTQHQQHAKTVADTPRFRLTFTVRPLVGDAWL